MPYSFLGSPGIRRRVEAIRNDPPTDPSYGRSFIVGDSPTGAWVGKEGMVATQIGTNWRFYCTDLGFRVWNAETSQYIYNTGRGWLEWPPPIPGGSASWGAIVGSIGDQLDLASALNGKAASSHSHSEYAVVGHDHSGVYAPASHNHDGVYAPASHNHDSSYSPIGHGHAQLHDRQHSITEAADHTFPGGATFLRADGTFAAPGGSGDPWTIVKLAADFTVNVTANTNVTGLFFTPAAGKTYAIYGAFLLRTATATTGARPGISWPTVADGGAWVDAPSSLTAAAMRIWGAKTTQNAASTGLADTTSSHYARLEGLIVAGATPSGNFQITLASETAGVVVTMKAGSYIMIREI